MTHWFIDPPQEKSPYTPLSQVLVGKVAFIKGRINGRTFLIGAENNEPERLQVQCI